MKPTPAQATILHLIVSAFVAGIIGALSSGIQYYYAHGQDLWLTLVFIGTSFPITFGAIRVAVWHAVQSSPALPQAEHDLGQQALQLAQQAMANVENLAANVAPLFTHTHPTPAQPVVSRAVTTPAARAQAPQPIVFPQSGASHISFGDTGQMPVVTPPSA